MKRLSVILGLVILPLGSYAQSDDPLDAKFHKIYQSSYSQEVSDKDWAGFVADLQEKTYSVRAGDSLWALSEVFFGDGFFWSKIWSYNAGLTNPHLLSIGKKIQFFTGSIDRPPGMTVGFNSGNMSEVTISQQVSNAGAQGQSTGGLYPGAPSLPGPRMAERPLLKTLPASFEEFSEFGSQDYTDEGMSMDIRPPELSHSIHTVSEFFYSDSSDEYPRIGEFIESEQNKDLIGLHDTIYIRATEKLIPGEVLTLMGPAYRFSRSGTNGTVIKYVARVQIEQQVKDDRYLGTVVQSLSGVRKGAWLVRQPIPTILEDMSGRVFNENLKVIGGGQDNISRIYGRGDVIYLQGGKSQGVQLGDIMPLYKLRSIRNLNAGQRVSPRAIGYAKVYHVEDQVSSAFVVSSSEPIMPGDETAYSQD